MFGRSYTSALWEYDQGTEPVYTRVFYKSFEKNESTIVTWTAF